MAAAAAAAAAALLAKLTKQTSTVNSEYSSHGAEPDDSVGRSVKRRSTLPTAFANRVAALSAVPRCLQSRPGETAAEVHRSPIATDVATEKPAALPFHFVDISHRNVLVYPLNSTTSLLDGINVAPRRRPPVLLLFACRRLVIFVEVIADLRSLQAQTSPFSVDQLHC